MEVKKSNKKAFSDINVTPFVDVMLVLLVIFMVTAPLLDQGIDVNLPVAKAARLSKDQKPVVLYLKRNKEIIMDSYTVPENGLETRIKLVFRKRTNKDIFIKADKELPYGFVANIISKVKEAGITRIGLVTIPPDEGNE
ncbi:MAG: biopolymer transporter ExbD [Oligoflexia bacterium]|nr:biopolymer transporter ExbD [Oligoflexia bacterium]